MYRAQSTGLSAFDQGDVLTGMPEFTSASARHRAYTMEKSNDQPKPSRRPAADISTVFQHGAPRYECRTAQGVSVFGAGSPAASCKARSCCCGPRKRLGNDDSRVGCPVGGPSMDGGQDRNPCARSRPPQLSGLPLEAVMNYHVLARSNIDHRQA